MVDEYWYGDVDRISPEAPVPVVRVIRKELRAGAAANVHANCVSLGCHEVYSATLETARKIRVVGKSQQVVRIDFDEEPLEEDVANLERRFKKFLLKVSIVLFSDYSKGSLTDVQSLIQQAKAAGKTVLVDPKGHDYTRYEGADLIKPNISEMREMVGGWRDVAQMNEKALSLRSAAKVGAILLTRAAEGMTLYEATGTLAIPSTAQEVYDVTGAGDTAIAALAVALWKGGSLSSAAWYANKAAGIAVSHFGTVAVKEEEVFK